jgi:aryl-alcohol dehydrogenase-like predicted oxidoreductase
VLSSNAALQMATSLGRLQASSVDLVYLHSPDPTTHIADTMRVMDALHRTVRPPNINQTKLSRRKSAAISHNH